MNFAIAFPKRGTGGSQPSLALRAIGFVPLFLVVMAVHAADVAITPPKFEVVIGDRPVTESLRIFNFSDKPTELEISVANWILDQNNEVVIVEPTEQSLDQWMLINPLRLTVPAKDSATVRFSIRPRVAPEPGEHRALIYVSEVNPQLVGNLLVRGKIGVAVYGYVGEVTRTAELHGCEMVFGPEGNGVLIDIANKGTAHVRINGQYAIWPANAYPGKESTQTIPNLDKPDQVLPEHVLEAGKIPETPILPGYRRKMGAAFRKDLPPGDYMLDLNGKVGAAVLDEAIPFTITEPETKKDGEKSAQ